MKKMVNIIRGIVVMGLISMGGFAFAGPVNINTADAKTIEKELNGIGLRKAEAIVAYRSQNGNFASADDLTKVKGIGIKIVDKNRDNILVETTVSKAK